ncbi:zinc ribbon domain-containing protein [Tundrisphaera lichenicola]|uniref:zinc ribbon domain-containing protein n=1 Tax=Tundrisphaera lichenicola TaxID=2029860 RepID=UPI003EBA66E5
MPSAASTLRDLHQLHQRATALRDRLTSGPKTLAARKAALAAKQKALEEARKLLQDEKVAVKKHEHHLQSQQAKSDDLRVKLNLVKKNEEYKAIQNQLALDKSHMDKTEGEILEAMERVDQQAIAVQAAEAEVKKFSDEVDALAKQIEQHADSQKAQLAELDKAIIEAETLIDEDQRERYRRTVKQRGADALAAIDGSACSGCYVTVTHQVMNELINGHTLQFCMACGRMLYLADEEYTGTGRS